MKHPHKALIALFTLAGASAFAQVPAASAPGTNTPRIDKREARQQARIAQGAANGSLTAQETQRLEKEQAHIDKAEDRAKADGTVTAKERHRISTLQDGASRDVHRKKHNARSASTPG